MRIKGNTVLGTLYKLRFQGKQHMPVRSTRTCFWLSGSHLLHQQNGSSSSHTFLLGVVPPPHSPKQKLSIECHDHTAQMLCMPVLEAELSAEQLLDVVKPGVPPSERG